MKTSVQKGHLSNASEHFNCVISRNLEYYYRYNIGDWKNHDGKETHTSVGCALTYKHPKKWQNSTQQRHIAT